MIIREKDRNIEKPGKGACDERKKQRAKRKQEDATEKPQREEKGEEGKEEMVGRTASVVRADLPR